MEINVNGVNIQLTQEQLKEIDRQLKRNKTIDDINSLEDAEEILKDCKNHTRYKECQFVRAKDWNQHTLETIIKAANFIDNNYQEWIPDFSKSYYKWIVWFEDKGSGLVFTTKKKNQPKQSEISFYLYILK